MIDRATLGATAALLAANASGRRVSESSLSSRQSSTGTYDSSLKVLVDEQKAVELHRLIEGGDWEGIILAASKFESDRKSLDGSISSHPDLQGAIEDWSHADGSQKNIQTLSAVAQNTGGRSRASSTSSAEQLGWPSIYTLSVDSGGESADELDIMVDLGDGSTELDNGIVTGDRARVWATAALLASKASSRRGSESSLLSRQSSTGTCDSSLNASLNVLADLHRLIEGGDWEGIILAARNSKSMANS
jgi:hypothetical protein